MIVNDIEGMKVTRKEIVAKVCYEVCKRVLPKYSSKKRPKKYEFWQLIAMFLYGINGLTYRFRGVFGWGRVK